MPLSSGAKLGPYEIVSPLGAGGMGEVYRARDTRLDRSVAIKVLPESLAQDSQFRERFDREARVVSQLEHPHICTLYDVGAQDGTAYLVMQLLDGETLAQRLQRGALPLAQALEFAIQIADALAAAHRTGVVHRDLKPGNIMLTKSGASLLDFGLATSRSAVVSGISGATMSAKLTSQGTILGTFEYMAPEQIEGAEADERTDIWAFGCVLYEMLTGVRPFSGKSPASLIANILGAEPRRLGERRPVTPPALDHVVHRCLEKDPGQRWHSIVDVAHELRWIASVPPGAGTGSHPLWKQPLLYFAALMLVLATALSTRALLRPAAGELGARASPPRKFLLAVPRHLELTAFGSASAPHFALSPDGSRIAYVASTADQPPSLWVQDLDARVARQIPGSHDASAPFWSLDGRSLGFFANGMLKTIAPTGERPQNVLRVSDSAGATSNGEVILVGRVSSSLLVVPVNGRAAKEALPLADRDEGHRWPQFLPDGRHFLYLVRGGGVGMGRIGEVSTRQLLAHPAGAIFARPGFLLFLQPRMTKLMAQPLDPATFMPAGVAVEALDPATYSAGSGYPALSASSDGLLAYWEGTAVATEPGWFDRGGKPLAQPVPVAGYNLVLSREGDRIAFSRREGEDGPPTIWVMDAKTGVSRRFSFTAEGASRPVWLPNGDLRFSSVDGSNLTLIRRPVSGSGREEMIGSLPLPSELAMVGNYYAADWTLDGRTAIVSVTTRGTGRDIVAYDTVTRRTVPVVRTEGADIQPQLSPDNLWIAYASDERGQHEVFVDSYPATGNKRQISVAGGSQPLWRRDGNELFFLAADRKLMSVSVTTGATFTHGAPQVLFQTRMRSTYAPFPVNYSVSPDGQRFLLESVRPDTRPTISIFENWTAALSR